MHVHTPPTHKDLPPRLLYPTRLLFKIEGEIKSFSDKKKLRVHYNQISITRNVKGSSLRKRKRGKKTQRNIVKRIK